MLYLGWKVFERVKLKIDLENNDKIKLSNNSKKINIAFIEWATYPR